MVVPTLLLPVQKKLLDTKPGALLSASRIFSSRQCHTQVLVHGKLQLGQLRFSKAGLFRQAKPVSVTRSSNQHTAPSNQFKKKKKKKKGKGKVTEVLLTLNGVGTLVLSQDYN